MKRTLSALGATLLMSSVAHAVPMTLLGSQTLGFETMGTGAVSDFFAAPIANGDFRVDSGSISTSAGGLDPASGSNFALALNNVNAFNDASWFLDISAYAADIDNNAFAVEFSYMGDTTNAEASSGTILIRSLLSDLSSPLGFNDLIAGSSDLLDTVNFDATLGYQTFSLLHSGLIAGTRGLQLNAGIHINSGVDGSSYALDNFEVRFYRINQVAEPGTLLVIGAGLVGLAAARRRRNI